MVGLPPRWEIGPFSATLTQDGLAECDQPGKTPYEKKTGNLSTRFNCSLTKSLVSSHASTLVWYLFGLTTIPICRVTPQFKGHYDPQIGNLELKAC